MPDVVPTTPQGVAEAVVDLVAGHPGRARVAIDAPPAAEPGDLADRVVAALAPRPALHVRADRFWHPASLRFESGRQDPDAWLDRWLDEAALLREVLAPFAAEGRALPALRDPDTDRSIKAAPLLLPPTAVLLVSGSGLLGRGLPFDVQVHVHLSLDALERRTRADERWVIPALVRYDERARPTQNADLVVRADDPRHPALLRKP
jgi:hypothetical protein